MVPVIRNVEGMNFADIEKAINLLGEKVTFQYLQYLTRSECCSHTLKSEQLKVSISCL